MIGSVFMAFQALAANKLRAALTMLGTIIGVTCVVALWNIGESGRAFMSEALSAIGQNIIFVSPKHGSDEEDQRRHRYRPLGLGDVAAIEERCPSVDYATPILFGGARAVFGANFRQTGVRGCFPSYFSIRQWELQSGAFFSEADVRSGNRVVLLGAEVAREIFGALDPLGLTLRMDGVPFRVIGVLKAKGAFFGDNTQDYNIYAPFTAAADAMGWGRTVHMIFVSAASRELIPQAKQEIALAIRASQNLAPDRKDSVELQDLGEVAQSVDQVLLGLTMLLGAIGAVSLLVGGIGIMNIMLVSVTERTREIGLRMALGATDLNVLSQFLIEAMVLSGFGGVVGAGLGLGVASGAVKVLSMTTQKEWPLVLNPASVVVALCFACAIGIFFGFYPAWRASRLDPIVALRHE
ncbi:MAG: ABC transporter permease [Planctomycetes bacterium]|nr:ABC transporter permease [Planctomycetota bacterium]